MNGMKQELQGKVVILRQDYFKPEYLKEHIGHEILAQAFLCEGGFGCSPATRGSRIYGTFLIDGEEASIDEDFGVIERVCDEEEAILLKKLGVGVK